MRIFIGPIGKKNHVLVYFPCFSLKRLDDDRAINSPLLLETGMGMVPVGTAVANSEFVSKRGSRADRRKADVGHTIHVGRHEEAMPVN